MSDSLNDRNDKNWWEWKASEVTKTYAVKAKKTQSIRMSTYNLERKHTILENLNGTMQKYLIMTEAQHY